MPLSQTQQSSNETEWKKDAGWENHIFFVDDLHSENHRQENLASSVSYITPVKPNWFRSVGLQNSA